MRDTLFVARRMVGKEVIVHRIVGMDADHVVQEVDRDPCPILARGAMDEARALPRRQR